MPKVSLHIIAFDIPDPPDYGGIIDIYYKVKSLHEAGCTIFLHCFEYGRPHSRLLAKYCAEIWYYRRRSALLGISLTKPYIVNSRRSKKLLLRLQENNAPILFEGVHSTFYLNHPALKGRMKILRTHNVEHQYYYQLHLKEKSFLSKCYFFLESKLLKLYETKLQEVDLFLEISRTDKDYFNKLYPNADHEFIAPFHPFSVADIPTGSGGYCLYHGNLSHPENREAAMYLIKEVVPQSELPFIFAGRSPDGELVEAINKTTNCTLVSNPTLEQMDLLITDAHLHVLPTFQASGMKLKLLYALFKGRHIIVNNKMLYGTGLGPVCNIANTPEEMAKLITTLKHRPFTADDRQMRLEALEENYSNSTNAGKIITYLQQISP